MIRGLPASDPDRALDPRMVRILKAKFLMEILYKKCFLDRTVEMFDLHHT